MVVPNKEIRLIIPLFFVFLMMIVGSAWAMPKNFEDQNIVLRVGLPNIEKHNDPANIVITNDMFLIRNLVITLLWLSPDSNYYGFLAKKWYFSDDGKSIFFQIKEGLKFSNGEEITSEHISLSMKRLILLDSSLLDLKSIIVDAEELTDLSENIQGIEVTSKYEITFHFKFPYRRILYFFSRPESGIVHQDQLNLETLKVINWSVASGAYWGEKGENEFFLNKNNYFKDDSTDTNKMFEYIHIQGKPVLNDGYEDILNKKIDILNYGAVFDPMFQNLELDNSINVINESYDSTCYFQFNTKSKRFSDQNKRNSLYQLLQTIDWHPYKSETFFKADQLFDPNSPYHLSQKKIQSIKSAWQTSKEDFDKNIPIRIKYADFFGNAYLKQIEKKFNKLGLKVEITSFRAKDYLEVFEKDDWDLMFMMMEMFPPHTEYSLRFLFGSGVFSIIDPNNEIKTILKSVNDDNSEAKIQKISEMIYDRSLLLPIFFTSWPIYMDKNYYFEDYNNSEVNFMLWKVRTN